MSKVIDNRVVSMEFDNAQFEKNVQTSMKTLDNLNKTIDNLPETGGKGLLSGLSKAANNVDLSGISSGIEAINSKFSALGIAGQEVIRDITRSAIQFGKNAWNMTFGQITSGGKRRSENIANARFTLEGMGLNFEDYRKDIDYAVDGTAYGFDQAAKAASVFASSGVAAGEDMQKALRGISGVAAMTNADFDEIAYVFEKVNGMGKVTGETLNMINGRGLNATAALGKALGKTEEEIHKMVSKGQIDFATFAKAMDDAFGEHSKDADRTFGGVTKNIKAQLSKIGQAFYDPLLENDSGLIKMLQSVKAKIKEIKTVTDPFATRLAQEVLHLASIGKTWIDSFDASSLKPIFDGLVKTLDDVRSAESFIIDGGKGLFSIFKSIAKVGKDAFKEVFPVNIDKPITKLAEAFRNFVGKLVPTENSLNKLKRIFKGLFSAVSLGIKIFKDLTAKLSPLTDKVKELASKLLDVAANVGDFFTELNEGYTIGEPFKVLIDGFEKFKSSISDTKIGAALSKISDYLATWKRVILDLSISRSDGLLDNIINVSFNSLSKILYDISDLLHNLGLEGAAKAFYNFGINVQKAKNALRLFLHDFSLKDAISNIKEQISNLDIGNKFAAVFAKVKTVFISIGNVAKKVFAPVIDILKTLKDSFIEALSMPGGITNLAALLVIFESLRRKVELFNLKFKKFFDFFDRVSGAGIGGALTDTLKSINGYIINLSNNAKSDVILKCAAAIAILAVSMKLLATIPADQLIATGTAIAIMIGAIVEAMEALDKMSGSGGETVGDAVKGAIGAGGQASKLSSFGTTMIKMAAAIMILAGAMKLLSGVDYGDIVVGGIALGIFMDLLYEMTKQMAKFTADEAKSINKVAVALVIMSVTVRILASAIKQFDGMDWQNIVFGVLAVASMIAILVGACKVIDNFIQENVFVKVAAGMVIMAVAVKLLASAVESLGKMKPEQLAAGILGVAAAMTLLVIAVIAIDHLVKGTDFAKISTGFLMLGASIILIATAFKILGSMNPDQIAQALMVFTFTLAALAVVLMLANDSMLKAGAGLLMVAAGMLIFTAAVGILGSMNIMTLVKGLGALAIGLGILAVALRFIQGSIAGAAALLIVAVALIPFAMALMMLTSLNLADLAGTILVLVVALAALTVVCYAMTGALIGAAALLVLSVALLAFGAACAILVALPLLDLAATLAVVAAALLGFAALSTVLMLFLIPMAALAGVMILISAALVVLGAAVALFAMGIQIMAASGAMGANALLLFCTVLGTNLKTLTKGAAAILALSAALVVFDAALIVAAISITACGAALIFLSTAMLVFAAAAVVFAASLLLVSSALTASLASIKELLDDKKFKEIGKNAMSGIVAGFKEIIPKAVAAAKELGQKVVDGLKDFGKKLVEIGKNAIMGFVNGLKSKLSDAKQAAATIGQGVLNKLKSTFKIKSPSRETMAIGELVDEGLAKGITDNADLAEDAAGDMADSTIDAMSAALATISDALTADAEPTITPVMDLSEIQNGVTSMDSLLDQKRTANISANYNANKMYEQEQAALTQAQLSNLGSQLKSLSDIMANPTPVPITNNVVLQGDAAGVFKLVRNENTVYTKMHGKSALA